MKHMVASFVQNGTVRVTYVLGVCILADVDTLMWLMAGLDRRRDAIKGRANSSKSGGVVLPSISRFPLLLTVLRRRFFGDSSARHLQRRGGQNLGKFTENGNGQCSIYSKKKK